MVSTMAYQSRLLLEALRESAWTTEGVVTQAEAYLPAAVNA